jgi:cysteine desulfurase/selenocysteine lyase
MDGQTLSFPDKADAIVADEFLGRRESIYLSTCTRGLLPKSARAAVDAHLDDLATGRTDKAQLFELIGDVRGRFAKLINAGADEIAFTKNVSEGLNMVAAGIDLAPSENVVVTLSLEHPNNVYPWLNQKGLRGIEVRTVPDRDGAVDIDAMHQAIDDRTRLVTLPTVSFSPGFRADVTALGKICREQGIFLLVDAVQSTGVLHTDVEAMMVDGLATSTQKGLCGLYGMGFLYCRRAWADRLNPVYLARFGVDLGDDAHEATMGTENYSLMAGAGRFDLGNYNYPATAAAQQSLRILASIGTENIERHVTALSHGFVEGLLERGLPAAGGAPGPHLGHIVSVGTMGEAQDHTDDSVLRSLSDCLSAENVVHTIRRGMLRFAFHVYNTPEDVAHVLNLIDVWRSQDNP